MVIDWWMVRLPVDGSQMELDSGLRVQIESDDSRFRERIALDYALQMLSYVSEHASNIIVRVRVGLVIL